MGVALRGPLAIGASLLSLAALAEEHFVHIRDSLFVPESLAIKAGDSVRWVNNEKRTSHSVLFPGTPALESERMMPEESWSRRFETPGNYEYTCGPHPHMHGVVTVTP